MKGTADRTEQLVREALHRVAEDTPERPDLADLRDRAGGARTERGDIARRAPRRARVVAALAATLVIPTGALAIASGGYLGEDSPGAVHRPMADLAEVVRTGGADIPFAPHRSLDDAVVAWVTAFDADETMATDGMIDMAADAAVCSWMDQWRTATLSGDGVSASEALRVVEDARGWPWWSLVNKESAYDRLGSHVRAMETRDVDHVTYVLGLNCLPAMTDAPTIAPTGGEPQPDGVAIPDDLHRGP